VARRAGAEAARGGGAGGEDGKGPPTARPPQPREQRNADGRGDDRREEEVDAGSEREAPGARRACRRCSADVAWNGAHRLVSLRCPQSTSDPFDPTRTVRPVLRMVVTRSRDWRNFTHMGD